ncbi:MAG: hypothetical protein K2J70_05145 [Muribaculaceae bacterium]|nr:hypothetical protein [Muribaculaceae bacterium]
MKNIFPKPFSRYFKIALMSGSLIFGGMTAFAQSSVPPPGAGGPGFGNSAPAPGSGGSFRPNTPVGPANGLGWNPGPGGPGPGWSNGWGPGWNNWNSNPPVVVNVAPNPNQGVEKVIACGYDAQGIWRVIPMVVSYVYNGVQYNVTVLNAYNPWTDAWNTGIDQPAYNTYFYLRGVYYNFYAPLSTGTFYFNL